MNLNQTLFKVDKIAKAISNFVKDWDEFILICQLPDCDIKNQIVHERFKRLQQEGFNNGH